MRMKEDCSRCISRPDGEKENVPGSRSHLESRRYQPHRTCPRVKPRRALHWLLSRERGEDALAWPIGSRESRIRRFPGRRDDDIHLESWNF